MQTNSQIYEIVKHSNTRLALLSLIGFIIVAGLIYYFFSSPYWLAQLRDPILIADKELAALPNNTTLYNHSVSGSDMFDIGFEEYTYDEDTGRRISTDAYFGILQISFDEFLLVRTKDVIDEKVTDYTGVIIPIPDNMQREVVNALLADLEKEDITDIIILPILFDTLHDDSMWYVGTAVLIALALLPLWGFITLMKRGNPLKHPVLKKLGRFGEVEMVVDSIEKDRTMGEESVGKLYLTRNWAFTKSAISFDAMSLRDVVWTYPNVTQHRTNGIPTGKSYSLYIYDKHGVALIVADKEQEVTAMLQAIMARAPWVVAGYSNQTHNIWKQNPSALIAEVERRRTESAP
jgi:hypothetical protein